jgi:hypothetical protein
MSPRLLRGVWWLRLFMVILVAAAGHPKPARKKTEVTPNATTIVLTDADLRTAESFAAKVKHLEVAVLPSDAVHNAASEINRLGAAELSVLANCERWTVYRVCQQGASIPQSTLLIDAETGKHVDLCDVANEEDERKRWLADFPLLVSILNDLAS